MAAPHRSGLRCRPRAAALAGVALALVLTAGCGGGEVGTPSDSAAGAIPPTVVEEAPAVAVAADAEAAVEEPPASSDDGAAMPTPPAAGTAEPIIALDDSRVSDAQRSAAQQLIDVTAEAAARFATPAAATAAGYLSIGDGDTGYEHFVNVRYLVDGRVLDPGAIESVVFAVNPDGSRELASAMYILEAGSTMADVPDVAGELTTWHDHQDLCWDGLRVVGHLVDGRCPTGEFRPTPPMLHVWLVEHPCGPFAGIEGHGGGCGHHAGNDGAGHGSPHHHGAHTG